MLISWEVIVSVILSKKLYRGADKSLARPGRKQARKHVRDVRNFNIETRAVNNAILTEKFACFLPRRARDLSAPLYMYICPIAKAFRDRAISL